MINYNLSDIKNIINNFDNEEELNKELSNQNLSKLTANVNNETYYILRYNKTKLNDSNINTLGLNRSIVIHNNKIISFSPPKSISFEEFSKNNKVNDIILEEFIDGTMINLFHMPGLNDPDLGDWQIATRSSVGGKNFFFFQPEHKKSFRDMFIETYKKSNFNFDLLSTNLCYSFVLQHPLNRIVTPLNTSNLYFISAYKINNETFTITKVNNSELHSKFEKSNILIPKSYNVSCYKDYSEISDKWAAENTNFDTVGIMLYSNDYSVRSKIRNPNYEAVRELRGNQPKLQFRYLALRQISHDKVREFLKFYPEYRDDFNKYNKQVIKFEETLFDFYVKCHMKKLLKHKDIQYEYKVHIYHIHNIFLNKLKPKNKFVTLSTIKEYLNSIHPAKLMYSLNYSNYSETAKISTVTE